VWLRCVPLSFFHPHSVSPRSSFSLLNLAFLLSYAPWCGHCKRLAPTWDELATAAKGKFTVAKVDCTTDSATCTENGVNGYPTVKLFKDGKLVQEYEGARTVAAFTEFVQSKAGKTEL
jgi:thioredoxin domain-containing protein 5